MSSHAAVLLSALLLLGYFAARVVALSAFPPFVDEAFHINFGRLVLEQLVYAPQTSPGTLVDVIDAGRPRLSLYDLAP